MSDEPGGGGRSFEERLKAARRRQGLEVQPKSDGKGPEQFGPSPLSIGLRVGVELASALAVAFAIGYGLDRWFGTTPLFIIIFILLGGAAGVLNVWRMFAPRDGSDRG